MERVDYPEFMRRTDGGWPTHMAMSTHEGEPFECACGDTHDFSELTVQVLKELPKGRLVLTCPDEKGVTCVRLKGLLKPKIEPLFGTVEIEEYLALWAAGNDQAPAPTPPLPRPRTRTRTTLFAANRL